MNEFLQVKEINYDLIYAAMINNVINKVLLAIITTLNWPMW